MPAKKRRPQQQAQAQRWQPAPRRHAASPPTLKDVEQNIQHALASDDSEQMLHAIDAARAKLTEEGVEAQEVDPVAQEVQARNFRAGARGPKGVNGDGQRRVFVELLELLGAVHVVSNFAQQLALIAELGREEGDAGGGGGGQPSTMLFTPMWFPVEPSPSAQLLAAVLAPMLLLRVARAHLLSPGQWRRAYVTHWFETREQLRNRFAVASLLWATVYFALRSICEEGRVQESVFDVSSTLCSMTDDPDGGIETLFWTLWLAVVAALALCYGANSVFRRLYALTPSTDEARGRFFCTSRVSVEAISVALVVYSMVPVLRLVCARATDYSPTWQWLFASLGAAALLCALPAWLFARVQSERKLLAMANSQALRLELNIPQPMEEVEGQAYVQLMRADRRLVEISDTLAALRKLPADEQEYGRIVRVESSLKSFETELAARWREARLRELHAAGAGAVGVMHFGLRQRSKLQRRWMFFAGLGEPALLAAAAYGSGITPFARLLLAFLICTCFALLCSVLPPHAAEGGKGNPRTFVNRNRMEIVARWTVALNAAAALLGGGSAVGATVSQAMLAVNALSVLHLGVSFRLDRWLRFSVATYGELHTSQRKKAAAVRGKACMQACVGQLIVLHSMAPEAAPRLSAQQRLAFAKALHSRLGVSSPLAHLREEKLLDVIADLALPEGKRASYRVQFREMQELSDAQTRMGVAQTHNRRRAGWKMLSFGLLAALAVLLTPEGGVAFYGRYCGPADGANLTAAPVDGLDSLCKRHDGCIKRYVESLPEQTSLLDVPLRSHTNRRFGCGIMACDRELLREAGSNRALCDAPPRAGVLARLDAVWCRGFRSVIEAYHVHKVGQTCASIARGPGGWACRCGQFCGSFSACRDPELKEYIGWGATRDSGL